MEPWLEHFARANFRRGADTAHDLKTPLNVAVLNLELLRMRLRKIAGGEDEKIESYTKAIEAELRRLGHIFDAFFLLSTPPKNDEQPGPVDVAAICAGFGVETDGEVIVHGHESRIRQACKLFFDAASKLFGGSEQRIAGRDGANWAVTAAGNPETEDVELTRLFKFYYTDPQGNPDLSLASARLIVETYGGEVNALEESGKVSLRLSFPLGAK
ncbi:MAG TPA: histidine kinase dimerization/phospho-acceptor domain-containing protein [Thermoanaerobaculia bacterium]|nr:histidine kinase dimerization/phospho-acceptor domain-containing protein [Thermoanaerobaculia bacterium]